MTQMLKPSDSVIAARGEEKRGEERQTKLKRKEDKEGEMRRWKKKGE